MTPRIGITGPFSGPRAAYGDLLRRAVEAASVEAEPVFRDDRADPQQAQAVARAFVADGVVAVIGHFNSDCARVAGAVYREAGIAFLMPAATAPDLLPTTAGYRICAPDDLQIARFADWLSARRTGIAGLWQDGSAYAARLAGLIEAAGIAVAPHDPAPPHVLLGAHPAVAEEIRRRRGTGQTCFVPDDCAIAEFAELVAGTDATVILPVPVPDYAACAAIALAVLRDALASGRGVARSLAQDPRFVDRQYVGARFDLAVRPPRPVLSTLNESG